MLKSQKLYTCIHNLTYATELHTILLRLQRRTNGTADCMKAAHLVETKAVDFLLYQIKFVKKVLGMALSLFHLACSQVFSYLALAVNKSPAVLFYHGWSLVSR